MEIGNMTQKHHQVRDIPRSNFNIIYEYQSHTTHSLSYQSHSPNEVPESRNTAEPLCWKKRLQNRALLNIHKTAKSQSQEGMLTRWLCGCSRLCWLRRRRDSVNCGWHLSIACLTVHPHHRLLTIHAWKYRLHLLEIFPSLATFTQKNWNQIPLFHF